MRYVVILAALLLLLTPVAQGETLSSPVVYTATVNCTEQSRACPTLVNRSYQPFSDLSVATRVLMLTVPLETGQRVLLSGKMEYSQTDEFRAALGLIATTGLVHVVRVMEPDGVYRIIDGSISGMNVTYWQHYQVLPLSGYYVTRQSGRHLFEVRAYTMTSQDPMRRWALARVKGLSGFGHFSQMILSIY